MNLAPGSRSEFRSTGTYKSCGRQVGTRTAVHTHVTQVDKLSTSRHKRWGYRIPVSVRGVARSLTPAGASSSSQEQLPKKSSYKGVNV